MKRFPIGKKGYKLRPAAIPWSNTPHRFSPKGLAPGGECDGISVFELKDMFPIEVKIDGVGAGSNSLDQTFELE